MSDMTTMVGEHSMEETADVFSAMFNSMCDKAFTPSWAEDATDMLYLGDGVRLYVFGEGNRKTLRMYLGDGRENSRVTDFGGARIRFEGLGGVPFTGPEYTEMEVAGETVRLGMLSPVFSYDLLCRTIPDTALPRWEAFLDQHFPWSEDIEIGDLGDAAHRTLLDMLGVTDNPRLAGDVEGWCLLPEGHPGPGLVARTLAVEFPVAHTVGAGSMIPTVDHNLSVPDAVYRAVDMRGLCGQLFGTVTRPLVGSLTRFLHNTWDTWHVGVEACETLVPLAGMNPERIVEVLDSWGHMPGALLGGVRGVFGDTGHAAQVGYWVTVTDVLWPTPVEEATMADLLYSDDGRPADRGYRLPLWWVNLPEHRRVSWCLEDYSQVMDCFSMTAQCPPHELDALMSDMPNSLTRFHDLLMRAADFVVLDDVDRTDNLATTGVTPVPGYDDLVVCPVTSPSGLVESGAKTNLDICVGGQDYQVNQALGELFFDVWDGDHRVYMFRCTPGGRLLEASGYRNGKVPDGVREAVMSIVRDTYLVEEPKRFHMSSVACSAAVVGEVVFPRVVA